MLIYFTYEYLYSLLFESAQGRSSQCGLRSLLALLFPSYYMSSDPIFIIFARSQDSCLKGSVYAFHGALYIKSFIEPF